MENIINYRFKAELYSRKDEGKLQSHIFERKYKVKFLKKIKQINTFYNSELKMHFQGDTVILHDYEIEIDNTKFELSDKMEKASDFVRRVHYMFDWIQIRTSMQGEVQSIKNIEELGKRWIRIKESLLSDYRGNEAEKYLTEIDARFENAEALSESILQYFNFGLLFPPIPVSHGDNWQHKRTIEFSEYDEEKFEEEITLLNETDNERVYKVNILSSESNNIELEQHQGSIVMCKNQHLPLSALVEVVFKNDGIANQWHFKLERLKDI